MWHGTLGGVDEGHQVGIQNRAPRFLGHAVQGAWDHTAHIVDQNIETAQLGGRFLDKFSTTIFGGKITDDADGFDALGLQLADRLIEPVPVARRKRNIAAFIGERVGDGVADALTGARDRGVFPFES